MLRGVVMGLVLLLLVPMAIIALGPGMARHAMGVNISGWRNTAGAEAQRQEETLLCVSALRQSADSRARQFRAPEAACNLCANLLASIPDPDPTDPANRMARDAIRDQNRFRTYMRESMSRRDPVLAAAFARREEALLRLERGETNPVTSMVDVRASLACRRGARL